MVKKFAWICEFCYRTIESGNLPPDWDLVWQSAVCPECQKRVAKDGGYAVVVCGAYASTPDPRASIVWEEITGEEICTSKR